MTVNLKYKIVTTRKPHVCFGCGRRFDSPAQMVAVACVDGGRVESFYLCMTCDAIASNMEYGDEFGFSELRDEALEMEEQNGTD